MNHQFNSYLHKQIPVMILLSVFPGLGYIFLSWLNDTPLRAIVWYIGILVVSAWGYHIYKQYRDETLSNRKLEIWYQHLSRFYIAFFALWLCIFLLFITEEENNLHYIAIFTEIGSAVVASILLVPDKKLFKPIVIMLMVPLTLYFFLINELYGYVLSIFSVVFSWVLIYAAETTHKLLVKTNFQANHDYLTGLKNRYYFINYLQDLMSSLQKSKSWSYLLLIDLDHFKTINDSLGHDIGDRLLQEVSARINSKKNYNSLLARLGGDEFVVVGLEYNNQKECLAQADALAQKILQTLKESYHVELHHLYISASIGVSLIDGEDTDASRLIKEADIAMYEAKEKGRDGVIVFDEEMEKRVEYNLEIEQLLHFALEKNEISIAFQPQMNKDGKIEGAETLVRWNNEKLGAIPPEIFISIAEHTGSMIELGNFIMETAFQTLNRWEKEGILLQQFSINVSMRQFFYYDFINDVRSLCEKYLSTETRKKIIFEVTESIIAEDVNKVVSIMDEIKQLGIRFSMDDFGTGYSSLSYLKRLPIDEIKIDRSFISDLNDVTNDQIMVSSILNMAQQFNLKVVAEGVENKEQLDFLLSRHCDIYQGFYYSKPLTDADFQTFYKTI